MRHVIVCPGCGDPHTTIDLGDAPRVKRRAEEIRRSRRKAAKTPEARAAAEVVTEDDLRPELDHSRRAWAASCASPGSDIYTCTACGASVKLDPDLSAPCGFRERDVTVPIPTRILRHPRTGAVRVVGRFMQGATVRFRVAEKDQDGIARNALRDAPGDATDAYVVVENQNGRREVLLPIDAENF